MQYKNIRNSYLLLKEALHQTLHHKNAHKVTLMNLQDRSNVYDNTARPKDPKDPKDPRESL